MNIAIDSVKINFDTNALWLLNLTLAIIMFGVALDLKISDFKRLLNAPKPALVGVFSQFVLLPALTLLLVYIINPLPSIAMGMILVAACPGGNISNFISHMAKGNTALSVSLTAFSTLFAMLMTPLNIQFWAGLYNPTAEILRVVALDPLELIKVVSLILGVPLILGMLVRAKKSALADRLVKILKPVSILIFIAFIVLAFLKNLDIFVNYIEYVVLIVFVHNAVALSLGFYIAKGFKLSFEDQKSLAIETGIQNSGLGLLLIFTFFDGLGGMALIAAWWGIWHIISGLFIATYWSKRTSVIYTN